ncbi:transmembrane protein 138-like [Neocloeon triangulifer]|uniref:transmembrane protein 138-like n=1 Tax=Neocloeon triangulifer TaxID=2078957 RepID=UPI00286F9024|nr:transmembrane protein 138-like [Neocloeon triangulifer]
MKLSVSRYVTLITVQSMLLVLDMCINAFSDLTLTDTIVALVVFILQDMALVFAIILIFLSFFSTFLFQAGLLSDVTKEFGSSIFISTLYLILSVALHWVTLQESTSSDDWSEEEPLSRSLITVDQRWPSARLPLYATHRFCSVIYYYSYKSTMLRIANSKYYNDTIWIKRSNAIGDATVSTAVENGQEAIELK